MATPATPQNLYVQVGNAQVFLSWDIVTGATSYDVQRSLDGVTFASVGTPSLNSYLDTAVLVGVQYYYKVGSTNVSGTSPYTSAQFVVPTLPGQTSLGEIRLRAQQRADREGSMFVTPPEWNYFINQSYYELYDLLITTYEDYYVAPRLLIPITGAASYDLPNGQNYTGAPALYKLYGVDIGLDGTNNAMVTLRKFDFISRNRYVYPQMASSVYGVNNLQYRLLGQKIHFIPTPSGPQNIGLWYYPRLTVMLKDTDVMDGISGWDQYVIVRAAKYALDKEESDTEKLDQELIFLTKRIEASAANRDAGLPDTISNTRYNGGFGGGYGPNGDGGSGGW